MPSPRRRPTVPAYATAALAALLTACGGGGSSSGSGVDVTSRSTAQSVTASGAALPNDSTEAAGTAVATAQAVYPGGAGVTVTCAGGGSATFAVSGGTVSSRANAAFDTGEVLDITFAQCRSATGGSTVNGRLVITVVGTAPSLVLTTASTDLSVALPRRTVTLNGSSTLTQTVAGSGGNTTTTNRWTAGDIRIASERPAGTNRYALRNVDYTRTIVAVNGVPVSSSTQGTSTLEAQLLFLPWLIVLSTVDPVICDAGGAIVSGRWTIDTPDDRIDLRVTPLSVSLAIDLGNNGSTDFSFFFNFATFFDAAG